MNLVARLHICLWLGLNPLFEFVYGYQHELETVGGYCERPNHVISPRGGMVSYVFQMHFLDSNNVAE